MLTGDAPLNPPYSHDVQFIREVCFIIWIGYLWPIAIYKLFSIQYTTVAESLASCQVNRKWILWSIFHAKQRGGGWILGVFYFWLFRLRFNFDTLFLTLYMKSACFQIFPIENEKLHTVHNIMVPRIVQTIFCVWTTFILTYINTENIKEWNNSTCWLVLVVLN